MKKIKVFLVVVLLCVIICIPSVQAKRSVEDAVEWAEGQVGSNYDEECSTKQASRYWAYMCMHFVGHAYDKNQSGFLTALMAWKSPVGTLGPVHLPSEMNNEVIPQGALVFFDTGIPEYHVGLYIGNGKVIHAWTDKIRMDNIEDIDGNYLGWRWPNGWADNNLGGFIKIDHSLINNSVKKAFAKIGINNCVGIYFYPDEDEFVIINKDLYGNHSSFIVNLSSLTPKVLGYSTEVGTTPITPNPYTKSTDIHITHCKIRPYKEGSWHHQVDVDMAPGQTFLFELEGRVRNKSNYDLKDVDIDYCFVKDKKDFDVQTKRRIDDDKVDIKEGERESKHTRRSRVVIADNLSKITVSTDRGSSFSLPITRENLTSGEITLYFYLDVETKDGEDRDVSSEAKTDEYAKLEIHLTSSQPPSTLNLSVPSDQEYIQDKIKTVFVNESIEIPIKINKSGQDTLLHRSEVFLILSGPEFKNFQFLAPLTVSHFNLNNNGEDNLIVQIDPIKTPGDYYLEIYVDPMEQITETNKKDNFNLIHFVVKKRKSLAPIINLLLNSK